ncbi:PAS domain-containing protein [Bradyrhizobium sp. HKCCYLS20291]|uniref:helix-turn-helix transcriptional regulator n=1 Tax=Bradyrhizobium sp. HKCCYLS20291 TaxID=3420766 RepID=UPI003EBA57F1
MPEKDIVEIVEMPRLFLDSLGVGISIVDVETGLIRFANAECCRIVGYTLEQLRSAGISFLDLTYPEDRDSNRVQHERLLAGEIDSYRIDKRYVRQDGSIVWGRVIVNPIHDAAGRVKWFCAVVEDITATKILESQLAAAEKLAGLSTFNIVVGTDEPSQTPETASSLSEVLSHVHPEDRATLEKTIRRAIAKRTGYTCDYRVVAQDGAPRRVRGMGSCVYSPSEGRVHLVGSALDLTASRQHQDDGMPEPIRNMLNYIEANWQRKISIEQLAGQFGISSRTVYQYFANSGMSLGEKIKQNRMQHARRMLCAPEPGDTVMSIALRCGFNNPGHFAKEYRKIYGESPSESLRDASLPAWHQETPRAPVSGAARRRGD